MNLIAHDMVSESPTRAAESAGSGLDSIPMFSPEGLYQREGELLGKGGFGAVRAIDGCPGLSVKERMIKRSEKKLTECELKTVTRLSQPGVIKYHQVIRSNDPSSSSWTATTGISRNLSLPTGQLVNPVPRG